MAQKSSKMPKLPLILTGNDLLEGHVVYFTEHGWSRNLGEATIAENESGAERLDRVGKASELRIVEPYLVHVELDGRGRPLPAHYREEIRTTGPTIDWRASA